MKYVKYFGVQLKRTMRLAVGVFPTAMLLFALLGLAAYFFFTKSFLAEGRNKYQVGVVGKIDETYLGFGIQAVQTLDSSRFMIDFLPMEEEEALDRFLSGELTTYVTVPEGFLDSLIYGRNDIPIIYVSRDGQKGLTGYLMEELSKIVSKLVISSQGSIYSMQHVFYDAGQTQELSGLTDEINMKLIGFVLSRTKLAELEELGISKGLLIRQYYFCALVLLYCFLFGTCGAPLFFGRNEQMGKWMKMRGIGATMQVLLEWGAFFLFLVFCIVIPLALLGRLTGDYAFLKWKLETRYVVMSVIPIAFLASAMQFMLYELFRNPVANLLLQFVAVIGMGYLSGFFFPAAFFPETAANIGRALPTGVAMEYCLSRIMEEPTTGSLWSITGYGVLFLGVAIFARARKIYGET